jgi:hypothetical protein
MVDAAISHPHEHEHNQAVTMLFAGYTQQEALYAFGVNQSNVRQLNVRLHQLDRADYTPRTGCLQVTIPRQDRQIRLPHLHSQLPWKLLLQSLDEEISV